MQVWAHLVWPAKDGERPETRGEPRVQDVLILLQRKGTVASECLGSFGGLLEGSTHNPVLAVGVLDD